MSYKRLKQAYDLIRQGANADALPIIAEIVRAEPDNCDAWWLAAFVAQNPRQKRIALERVLYLNPNHHSAQLLIQRLTQAKEPPPAPVVRQRKRRTIKWAYVGLSVFAMVSLFLVGLVLVDNFTGAGLLTPIERFILGEPKALGWVDGSTGTKMSLPNNPSVQLPITQQRKVNRFGSQIVGILDRKQAHRVDFYATRGDQLVVAVAFSNNGNAQLPAMVLWNDQGQVVAHEIGDEMFNLGSMFGARGLTYDVVQSGLFSVILMSNATGGPSGNYTLIVDTVANVSPR